MTGFDNSNYTGLSGEEGLIEDEMSKYFIQKMHDLETLHQHQQNRGLKEGEKPVVKLSAHSSVKHQEKDGELRATLPSSNKLSSMQAHALFKTVSSNYNKLKKTKQLTTQQELFKNHIEVAVRCSRYLINESALSPKERRVFGVTQAMFCDYFALFPDDRVTLRLQLNFRDILKDRGFDDAASLSSLLMDEDSVTRDLDSVELSENTIEKDNSKIEGSANLGSIEELTARFLELNQGSIRAKVLNIELAKLSKGVAKFIYHNTEESARKQHLGLALAVEAFRIQQMQLSEQENIRGLAKSMQKSAKYFRVLYQIYNDSDESAALKEEIKKAYQLMDARANNYEQMLACSFVEKSKVTSGDEKGLAYARRLQYKSASEIDLGSLCVSYRELMDSYGPITETSDSFDSLSSEDKYKLLNIQIFDVADFALLQRSRVYLIDIQCQFLADLQQQTETSTQDVIITYESLQDIDILPMHKLHIDALLNSELGKKLQEAITLHLTIKSNYFKHLLAKNPAVTLIKREYFCADFRLQSYKFLFAACSDNGEPENMELLERNCWDIINAGENSSPILVLLARHKLDSLRTFQTDFAEVEIDSPSLQEVIVNSATKITLEINQTVTPKAKAQLQDDETIWDQLCSTHVVRSVCFVSYLEKIRAETVISKEDAEFLYKVATDNDRPLLVDENNIDAFCELYSIVVCNYFVPEEFESLEHTVGENIVQGREHELISSDKLMVKALDIHDEVLKHIRLYRPELQLKVILSQIEVFYKMRRVVPKREFLDRCENALKDAQECIHLEKDSKAKIAILDLIKKTRLVVKNAPLEKDQQTCIATDNYMLNVYLTKHQEQQKKAEQIAQQPWKIAQRLAHVKHVFNQHTTLSQIRGILHVALRHDLGVWQKVLPILYSVNAQLDFLTHLQYRQMEAINSIYLRTLKTKEQMAASKVPVTLSWLNAHYLINLIYYAKLAEMLEEEKYAIQIQIVTQVPKWLEEAQETKDTNFGSYSTKLAEFGEMSKSMPTFEQARQKIMSVLDLDIPKELYLRKSISADCHRAIQLLQAKKYWQAMYSLANDDSAFACFIKVSILYWAYKVISVTAFASTLADNQIVMQSLSFTLQAFEKEIESLIPKVKVDLILKEQARKLASFKFVDPGAYSIFARRVDEPVAECKKLEVTDEQKKSLVL